VKSVFDSSISMPRIGFIFLLLIAILSSGAFAQSGRLKDPKAKPKPKPNQRPVSESVRPVQNEPAPPDPPVVRAKSGDDPEAGDVVRISSNLVPIPVSVVDAKGHAVTTLKLTDFELWIDGQLRTISDMSRSETPVRMAMLFDNSGSIDFARDFEKQAAIHFFRRVMRPTDEAAIYSVETDSYLAQPLTSDIRRLEQTIASFGKPEGATSLFDAMIDAAAYLRPYVGRRIIVIVSDGVETTSRADFETTMRQMLVDNCQIYIVQTGLYEGVNVRALAAERRMEHFAIQSGGAAYIPKSTADLETAFKQIAGDLAQQYVLSYYQSEQNRDGRFHLIELRIKSRQDVRLRARRGYYSPKS